MEAKKAAEQARRIAAEKQLLASNKLLQPRKCLNNRLFLKGRHGDL